MKTLNQQIKILSDFASGHKQINSFGTGHVQDFAVSGVTVCPAMWVDFEPAQVDESSFTNVFTVYLCDRVQKGDENGNDALSDMQQVALDLIAYLKAPITYYNQILEPNITLTPFFEPKFDEELSGVYFTIQIRQAFLEDRCQIPFNTTLTT